MTRASISNLALLNVTGSDGAEIFHGCSQDWYGGPWKRGAGCGPSTFSNVLWYTRRREDARLLSKADFLVLMNDVWKSVTPGFHGIPSTQKLVSGITAYTHKNALDIKTREFQVPEDKAARSTFAELVDFLAGSLAGDMPVAFLSLDKGEEENLDTWHWVTLISVEYNDEKTAAFIEVLDNCKHLRADLALWFKTTGRGGGFVGFY